MLQACRAFAKSNKFIELADTLRVAGRWTTFVKKKKKNIMKRMRKKQRE